MTDLNTKELILELKEAVSIMPLALSLRMPILSFGDYISMKEGNGSVLFSAWAPYTFMFGNVTGKIFVDPIFFGKPKDTKRLVLVYFLDYGKPSPMLTEFFRDSLIHPHMFEEIVIPEEHRLDKVKYLIKFQSAILLPTLKRPVILKYNYDVRTKLNTRKATIEAFTEIQERGNNIPASDSQSIHIIHGQRHT